MKNNESIEQHESDFDSGIIHKLSTIEYEDATDKNKVHFYWNKSNGYAFFDDLKKIVTIAIGDIEIELKSENLTVFIQYKFNAHEAKTIRLFSVDNNFSMNIDDILSDFLTDICNVELQMGKDRHC